MADALRKPVSWSFAEEAAERGISVRHLKDLVNAHQVEVLQAGGRVLFEDVSRTQLTEALRQCRKQKLADKAARDSKLSPVREQPRSTSVGPSAAQAYSNLLALTEASLRKKPAPRGKPNSTVVPFTGQNPGPRSRKPRCNT